MPLTALEQRFGTLEATNKTLAAEVHALTALISEVQGLREGEARARRRLRNVALGLILAIGLAAIVVFGLTLARVNTLIDSQAMKTSQTCQARNAQADAARARYAQLAVDEKSEEARRIWLVLASQSSGARVDCARLTR